MSENAGRWLRDEIENSILSNEFLPGERLDETVLATRFGVSRTPVREALMQLDAIGLIEIRPRRGAVVIDPGPHRVYEMFEVMAELEGLAGSLAARRLDEGSRAAITATHGRCEQSAGAGDSDAYYYDNEEFHKAIYAASRSDFLQEQCAQLHRRLRPTAACNCASATASRHPSWNIAPSSKQSLPETEMKPAVSCADMSASRANDSAISWQTWLRDETAALPGVTAFCFCKRLRF